MKAAVIQLFITLVSFGLGQTAQDFAEGVPVTPVGTDSVQRLDLPASVYGGVTRPDLGDIRIFNAAGETVPFTFLEDKGPVLDEQELPLYLVPEGLTETLEESLFLEIERGESSTTLRLETPNTPTGSSRYIIDRRGVNSAQELRFEWADTQAFVTEVQLETSDDLNRWQGAGTASLAQLEQGDLKLRKDSLSAPPGSYLRLSALTGETLPPLTQVFAKVYRDPQRQAGKDLNVEAESGEAGRYLYDLGGPFKVASVIIRPQTSDVLAHIRLESADNPDGPWTTRFEGVYFDLVQNGQPLQRGDIDLDARARYWRILPEPANGFGSAAPSLSFNTAPDTIIFLARGEAPFTLAYGSVKTLPENPGSEILNQNVTPTTAASTGPPFELGGEAALSEPRPFPWQSVLLWTVLIGGVGALGFLAVTLLRQSSHSKKD